MNRYYKAEKLRDIRTLVKRGSTIYSDVIAYKELTKKREIVEYSYKRLYDDVNAFGTKLLEMGMKGKHIAILGENSYLWVVSYLSIINGLGVVVPMDKELPSDDIANLLIKSNTDAIICSDTFVSDILEIKDKCPQLRTYISMNSDTENKVFLSIDTLIEEGRHLLQAGNRGYLGMEIDVDALCEIIFTSGTTGANKGVMLSQKSIMAVVYGAMSVIEAKGVSLSVLPISHAYECSCHILGGIYSGITVCFNDSLKRVVENMKLFKPNMSIMVPLFLESMYKNIWRESQKNNLSEHLKYGLWFSNLLRKIGIDKRKRYFKPVLDAFGGNFEQIVCGGAPLRPEIAEGLRELGIDILNGYGITECAPLVACNLRSWIKPGSIGRVIPNIEVRIYEPDEDGNGEIQVKGDNVMLGYYEDPVNTQASFTKDGWFRTGDIGQLDKHNFLYISGRTKNLIILSNGKNVHPEEIEDTIMGRLEYIKEVVVFTPVYHENEEPCITAFVYMDEEYTQEYGLNYLKEKLDMDMKSINRSLPIYKRVNNIMISETEFEKTTTKKIKRGLIAERRI